MDYSLRIAWLASHKPQSSRYGLIPIEWSTLTKACYKFALGHAVRGICNLIDGTVILLKRMMSPVDCGNTFQSPLD